MALYHFCSYFIARNVNDNLVPAAIWHVCQKTTWIYWRIQKTNNIFVVFFLFRNFLNAKFETTKSVSIFLTYESISVLLIHFRTSLSGAIFCPLLGTLFLGWIKEVFIHIPRLSKWVGDATTTSATLNLRNKFYKNIKIAINTVFPSILF